MPKLFLVRHAEPELTGILLGRLDPGLSPAGHESARRALESMNAAIAYASPLRRAQQTAAYLPASIERITLSELAEISLGEWQGLRWEEVTAAWPELARKKMEGWHAAPAPGGETWRQVAERAAAALGRIRSGPLPAIVVAHQGIHSAIASCLDGSDPHAFNQAYCQILSYDL